ncbi:peptidogalycan biosysnthesis protein [Phenylobacterium sp.]|uniref:peptidogalycan biosysnthesis protein n=1 Tax=Phenylobacterium sp. TaxID=1871053 RepID=UPI00286C80A5|nr:peptidogalycan biosysnthesis protein [Phenylobacterium sp.]
MLEARVVESLAQVDPASWDGLFADTLEGYDYLLAVERAGLPDFRWRYVLVSEGDALLAAAPAFLTEYGLETTLAGPGRRMMEGLRRVAPGALTLRLACIGSPCATTAGLGFAPSLAPDRRAAVLRHLLEAFEAEALKQRCGLFALKDVAASDAVVMDAAAGPLGYQPIASLPLASLDIDFANLDEYMGRLTASARKDMRRKLRALAHIRIEFRSNIDDVLDRVMALYAETRARAEMSFEHLTADYFSGVPREMGGRAFYVLYFQDDALLGANLLLQDGTTLLDKYFLMDAARGRPFNLYFLSWFTNVRLCLERGLTSYRSGQAAYENKLRLGSRLTRTSIYFRHRNRVVNGAMQLFAPMFAADPTVRRAA